MAITQEMFRFVAARRPERAVLHRIDGRLIRDRRPTDRHSMLFQLFGPGPYPAKLVVANAFAASADFVEQGDPAMLVLEPVAAFFREQLVPGIVLADLVTAFRENFPTLSALLDRVPPPALVEGIQVVDARLWNSFYAQTIRGCDRYVSTNYLADGLRVHHLFRLLWSSLVNNLDTWTGRTFDEYDTLIDLEAARMADASASSKESTRAPQTFAEPNAIAGRLAGIDAASAAVGSASLTLLSGPGALFRVPLASGAMKPPAVGDLLMVEQTLRRYEQGEVYEIESIMRGERRERTIRKLNRTSQTTTTESSFEQEESSSLKTDERFQLSSEAQQTAAQSFGVSAGVNVSGKFGPVQVSASVNASFDTSKSSSDSTSQEYAKTVTEEATRRVKSSIKETSSITILTETQDTSLRGLDNQAGTAHINGLYRWVDKIYDAQLVNYGRRLMFPLNVPAPASFYRALVEQNEAAALADLVEPAHPSRVDRTTVTPLADDDPADGFPSFKEIDEANYAKLAALYDVSCQPPPLRYLTGSKAFVHPETMQAKEMKEHDHPSDPSYVAADNTLTLDPGYRLTDLAVFAPKGAGSTFESYVDALKLGEDSDKEEDENIILVQVANASWYLTVRKDPDDKDEKRISTNFNEWEKFDDETHSFGGLVQPSIPITITANFEGMLTFTIVYKAIRTDEAFEAWQSSTFTAIVKGYNTKRQAFEQALAVASSKAESATQAQTFELREDQYRSIELTELKRGCIDLFSAGTAAGHTSIAVGADGLPRIVHDPAEGASIPNWRSPLANGSVVEFFELAFEWENTTYQFHPYYWAGKERWVHLAQATGADPVFEQFLRAGSASVVVPVRPGYERPVVFFLKTGLIWGGGYLSLFTSQDMLDVYEDVELGRQFDPPLAVGDSWEIRLPTNLVMLQAGEGLPEFPAGEERVGRRKAEVSVNGQVPF